MKFDILSEYCFVNMGQSPASETYNNNADGLPFYQGNADFGEIHPQTRIWCSAPVKIANKGDLLISVRAPIGALNIATEQCCIGRGLAALTPKLDKCRIKYIYFAIQSQINFLIANGTGSTFKAVNKNTLENLLIPVSSLNKQDEIVNIFEKLNNIINKRKEQLLLMDNAVKSRFIEMFGDPVTNSKMWEIDCLGNITTKIGSGMTPRGGKESYLATGVALIRSMNVHDGKFEYKDLAYISAKQAFEMKNVELIENDVLFNITGASVTRTCVVPNTILPARVNQHVAIIRCINESLNPIFLNNLFLQDGFKYKLLNLARAGGATREAITKQQLEDLNVILPPIEMQNQFADFVEQTDKSKFVNYKCSQTLANINRMEWMRCQTSNF